MLNRLHSTALDLCWLRFVSEWVRWLLVLVCLATPTYVLADSPCTGISCSDHGTCVYENTQTYCFCDEGYAAEGTSCVAAPFTALPRPNVEQAGDSIVRIARNEVGNDLRAVGMARRRYPMSLERYLPDDALWCSDFVSWVYRAAEVPLTGGYEGGWLVTNNNAMRSWFERRGLWVSKYSPHFATFQPQPGDYVRIRTRTWGHSAIVERVEGETLYIIEGNAGGRVRANRYRNFRQHYKIGGFGIVTGPTARRTWRAPLPAYWLRPLRQR